MKITGQLHKKFDTQVVSDKFSKREFVLIDNSSQYPQHILLQLTQDKCGLIDLFSVGDTLEVSINLRGREWTNPQGEVKYFNTIEAWRIEGVERSEPQQSKPVEVNKSESEDLPF